MAEPVLTTSPNIDSVLIEKRTFDPPADFSRKAHVKSMEEYQQLYRAAEADPEKFWSEIARDLYWFEPWTKVLEWKLPWAKWFIGGKINLSYNCLDRHMSTARRTKTAIIWEGEPGEVRTLTYEQLLKDVSKLANALKSLGIKTGDRVALYMGLTPELAIAMLACTRIGAVHSVIFGGFSAHALVDRITDAQAVAVITQDTGYRRGGEVKLKATVDEALEQCPSVKSVVVFRRSRDGIIGGTNPRQGNPINAKQPPWMPRRRSTRSIHREPPANRRASCTPPAGIRSASITRPRWCSILKTKTSIGAPPISAG